MKLTMTRLVALTIVTTILPVYMVSASPWGNRGNSKRAELQEALDYLKKHLNDKGMDLPAGLEPRGNFFNRPMEGSIQAVTKPIYDQRFNFGNQRETTELEPVKMAMNEQAASEIKMSEWNSINFEDAVSSEGELVDDLLVDLLAQEVLEELENAEDKKEVESTASFDFNEELKNYDQFIDEKEDQQQNAIAAQDNNMENELDDDLLNEVMMTYLEDRENEKQQTRNNLLTNTLPEEMKEEPLLTEEEEDILVAETILLEIEEELKRQKQRQEYLSKKKRPPVAQGIDTCPALDFLVDNCEVAEIDGIGGDGYRRAFGMPCNWHQICYTCGYSYGISQDICDEAFYLEMLSRCGKSQTCNDRADLFLLAVTEDRVPLLKSSSVCQQTCVRSFLLGVEK